jgi:hypothetical protein
MKADYIIFPVKPEHKHFIFPGPIQPCYQYFFRIGFNSDIRDRKIICDQMRTWLSTCFSDKNWIFVDSNFSILVSVAFEHEQDATLFKIRWT